MTFIRHFNVLHSNEIARITINIIIIIIIIIICIIIIAIIQSSQRKRSLIILIVLYLTQLSRLCASFLRNAKQNNTINLCDSFTARARLADR